MLHMQRDIHVWEAADALLLLYEHNMQHLWTYRYRPNAPEDGY